MERIKIREVILVEGKYDRIALEPIVDGIIITTDGFGIFKDKEKQSLIRRLAEERGLLVLTDSDGAGLVIRNFISGCVDSSKIKNAYIPRIAGKEKRKSAPSKDGSLGVEGMDVTILAETLRRAGISVSEGDEPSDPIMHETLYEDGYIGQDNSKERRTALLTQLALPAYLSTKALLKVINLICDKDRYREITEEINKSNTQ